MGKMSTEKTPTGPESAEEKRRLIVASGLGKMFRLSADPHRRLKSAFTNRIGNRLSGKSRSLGEEFWALRDISFSVAQGEVLGIIGKNGSGKTTLLQLIAGISEPTSGTVRTSGKISTLLELGSGFHRDFTGRENIYISGMISGFNRKEIDRKIDDIIRFADISRFVDQPVKTYSNGMFVRLSFAVQTYFDPEILLIDEVLSVGDIFFQQKCHERITSLINKGAATVIVSHEHYVIQKYCTSVLVLDKGECIYIGDPNVALQKYFLLNQSNDAKTMSFIKKEPFVLSSHTDAQTVNYWPSEEKFINLSHVEIEGNKNIVKFNGAAVCDENGYKCSEFEIGDKAYFYFEFELMDDIEIPVGGLGIINRMNVMIHAKISIQNGVKVPQNIKKGTRLRFSQMIRLSLQPGNYTFIMGLAALSPSEYSFAVSHSLFDLGLHNNLLLMVMHAGPIHVKSPVKGLDPPFFGYADLEGHGALSIVE